MNNDITLSREELDTYGELIRVQEQAKNLTEQFNNHDNKDNIRFTSLEKNVSSIEVKLATISTQIWMSGVTVALLVPVIVTVLLKVFK